MPYNTNIPQRLDFLSDPSQEQFLENFQQIQALLQQDHVDFNDADQGKHNKTTLTAQNSTQVTRPSSTEYNMFCGIQNAFPLLGAFPLIFNSTLSGGFIPGSYTNAHEIFFEQRAYTMSMRLPSGILIKWNFQENIEPRQVVEGENLYAFDWNKANDEERFVTQYWAAVFTAQPNVDTIGLPTFYVTQISDPTQIQFRAWETSEFNSPLEAIDDIPLKVIAIGV